uniref:DNA 3'-5' helicase n=1 Tax=Platynereis dumerilii TaxID=6359 RepID=Q2WBX7_PLADU|nr:putative RecQ family DNA helicase protein [Platynereis dumerilii]
MAAASSYMWEDSVQQCFGIDRVYDHQKYTIQDVLDGRDAFLSVCTGGGKSLCYMAYPVAAAAQYSRRQCGPEGHELVIVVTALTAIMIEQCQTLNSLGFTAVCLGDDGNKEEDIIEGKFQFIFTSPESILENVKWRGMLRSSTYQRRTGLIVIDEAHTVTQWGQSSTTEDQPFRPWFAKLGELRSLLPGIPVLALTATASRMRRKTIKDLLGMQACAERTENPDRTNIKLFVRQRNSSEPVRETFEWCLNVLTSEEINCPRTLIFCKSISDCSKLYMMFKMQLPKTLMSHVSMFHSQTPEKTKEKLRSDMSVVAGQVRILVCTSAAGMGVNYAGVTHVVHYGPPQEIDTLLQQQGRAGRSGEQAYNILFFNNRQLRNLSPEMLHYVRNEGDCRRSLLLSYYASIPKDNMKHRCCDICELQCNCVGETQCDDSDCIPVFLTPNEDDDNGDSDDDDEEEGLTADSADHVIDLPNETTIQCLTTSLKEYQHEMSLEIDSTIVVKPEIIHGITDDVITYIVDNCARLHTPDDVLANCGVSSYEYALGIHEILNKILNTHEEQANNDSDYLDMDD